MRPVTQNHKPFYDIPYAHDPAEAQNFDLYLPLEALNLPSKPSRLLVYVHGGAWRSGDKSDSFARGLVENLSTKFPDAALASVNYRLSLRTGQTGRVIHHPCHNEDVVKAIEHLTQRPELEEVKDVCLVGHSVGAFICLSISNVLEFPTPVPRLSSQVKLSSLILVDGIYGLVDFLSEYPQCLDFVSGAFSNHSLDYLKSVSPLYQPRYASGKSSKLAILILHSKNDTLVSTQQSELLSAHLNQIQGAAEVVLDLDSVSNEHNEVVSSPELTNRIYSWFASIGLK